VPTIKDVARAAGVSTASVSRVLTEHPATSPEMRERVLAAVQELNFRPNAVARSLRSTGTRTVGLVVSDLMNPYFTELARAVEDTARAAGYSVIVGNADEDPAQQDHYIRILLERQVDGLIVVPTVETSPLLREAADLNRHLVLVDRPAADVDAPTVLADSSAAISALVDHLVATGRTDPAIITGPEHAGTARLRLEHFRAALARHGLELKPERVQHGDFRPASGHEAMADLLAMPSLPDAVFVTNGSMALGVLQLLAEQRETIPVRIPEDLALAVFDDMPWFTLLSPTVTAIAQPTAQLGQHAMRLLLARIAGSPGTDGGAPDAEALECRLVLRESTLPRRSA
jgi:LacI family transcriptional regulator